MNEPKQRDRGLGLVALKMTDEMPVCRLWNSLNFALRFLNIVLANIGCAGA